MANIRIFESYKITDVASMRTMLNSLDASRILNRSIYSLENEWLVHNLFYKLHLFRSRTKDVDLNSNVNFVAKFLYFIIGNICRIIWK